MFKWLYEKATGTPWTTGRYCATEFGPTPGARYRHIVAVIPDEVLLAYEPAELHKLLAEVEAQRQTQARHVAGYLRRSQSIPVPAIKS